MPKVSEEPQVLKPFTFHGIQFGDSTNGQAHADCPLCGRDGKFFVNTKNGKWDCKKCSESGNATTFLRKLQAAGSTKGIEDLAKSRGLLSSSTLVAWGIVRSTITGEWLVPGHSLTGEVANLSRYVKDLKTKKMILKATAEMKQALHGVHLFDKKCETVYLCEGPWDAMILWEILRAAKKTDDGYALTASVEASIATTSSVLAVPGCGTFHQEWSTLFAGKRVIICYDSDHPREHPVGSGKFTQAGWDAAKKVSLKLSQATEPPESIHVLRWGPDGYATDKKSGYDLRDYLTESKSQSDRVALLGGLLGLIEPIPEDWAPGRTKEAAKNGGVEVQLLACSKWDDLIKQWKKAMNWTEGLDRALSIMLASVMSTDMIGDQLWVRVISPPSTGKTQLCNGLGTARKRVRSVGNFTGLHSGFQTDAAGEEDHSLLSQIKGMTLVVKDGDTILKNPNREKLLGQVRDAYDMNCAVAYGNRVKREYTNHRFTFILAGTEALMEMDSAELGARFIDCVVMNGIDGDMETDVNRRSFYRIINNRGISATESADTTDDPEILKATAMTGGFVEHLRVNGNTVLGLIDASDVEQVQREIDAMAKFIAFSRARPSKTQSEAVTREMSARLNAQLTKLALCVAGVLGRGKIDAEVMRRVRQCALDTARGQTLNMLRLAHASGRVGVESDFIASTLSIGQMKVRELLRFLKVIGAVECFVNAPASGKGRDGRPRWRLTNSLAEIYEMVDRNDSSVA
jgi:hypothetical protein